MDNSYVKQIRIILDLCAYIGASWFLILNVVFGPIAKTFNKNYNVVDVEKKEFLNEQSEYRSINFNQQTF